MSLTLAGATAVGAGVAGGTGLLGDGLNYHYNHLLAEENREFESNEARAAREWSSLEAEKARDWQTNANKIAMDFNREEAAAQRAWEQEMSSTAHQREMQDLRAAGLNPILAANSGASFGSGSSASAAVNSTSVPTATSARGSSAHASGSGFGFQVREIGKAMTDILNTAKKVNKASQRLEKSYDLDDFFQASLANSERIMREEAEKYNRGR